MIPFNMADEILWVFKDLPMLNWHLHLQPHTHTAPTSTPTVWYLKHLRPLFNTLRPRQNGRYFPDDIFKCIFLNENVWIPIKIPVKFVPKGPINNITALLQIMAWRRPGDKPLSETMIVTLLTNISINRPQWVKDRHAPQLEWNHYSFTFTKRGGWNHHRNCTSNHISIKLWDGILHPYPSFKSYDMNM